jgi:hypothetical protein
MRHRPFDAKARFGLHRFGRMSPPSHSAVGAIA